jgi:predicted MFS family arabinose efflux permease
MSTAGTRGEARAAPRLRWQILAATFLRLVMNTAHRMVYPFLPAISRGLGVPQEALSQILAVRGALGMTSPLFGGLPDRFGRRQAMLIGMGVFLAGIGLVALFPNYWTFAAFLILVVVAKFIFDPAMQAYLGDRTPYNQRGLVIAFTELGWSGAALVGFPLMGFLIARGGWRAPFLPLAALALLGSLVLWLVMPRDLPGHGGSARPPAGGHWAAVWRSPAVLGALGVGVLISTANETMNVVFGTWMEQTFALTVVALGLSTTVIGLADLAGESLVAVLADRLGKRRAIGLGLAASALAYGALPFIATSLQLALVGLFLVFITFEFTIVASIPLMTELVPEARGRVMSANVAAHAAGRMAGALLGAWLFGFGFAWIGVAAVLMNLAAFGLLVWLVREHRPPA